MAKRKRSKQQEDEVLVDIVQAREQAQDVFEKYQVPILGGLLLFVILVGGYFVYTNLIQGPKEISAADQMYRAEYQFSRDSFALALENPGGGYPGFLDIIDQYGSTKAGNLAHYYAGVSYLHLGLHDAALEFMKDFKADGEVTPATKNGVIGDIYAEKGDLEQALSFYKKAMAAAKDDNYLGAYFTFKTGMLLEKQGQAAEALKLYQDVKVNYPESDIAQDIERYIARLGG